MFRAARTKKERGHYIKRGWGGEGQKVRDKEREKHSLLSFIQPLCP